MSNFARSLPHNAINKPVVADKKPEINIKAQHKKWVKQIRQVQASNRRARTSVIGRLDEYSNVQVAVIGSILTSLVVATTIGILMALGF